MDLQSTTVATEAQRAARLLELSARDREEANRLAAEEETARRSNKDFVQVYPKGWNRIGQLIRENPAAARVYTFLAEHIDSVAGAVVVSMELIAKELGVAEITIRRQTKYLEEQGAIVRIRVGTGIYAYCLDPNEVWKAWDDKKPLAAFHTKTLALKSDRANGEVRRKLKFMMTSREMGEEA